MLELKNIKKTYKVGEIETKALNGINVAFREKEFVAILGASGSGKTTCLNIIGGLDRYDNDGIGEMTIKGKKTATFKDAEWDAYRNNSIGFVFQSYNLITHLSIVSNVELGMTLSGVSGGEKRQRAIDVLKQVGLKDHLHKKPNQLSGGQMQRVAIARALANNPEILLCDEPTGALDSKTSKQIMNLIRDLSKERLVIMVTHNPEIAEEYADRTIKFEDGVVVDDTNPHIERPKADGFNLKKTAMSYFTALNLSWNNILTKKGRTFLTAFASSIGIIGIAVIMSLSNGFQLQIDKFQEDALAEFPIVIMPQVNRINREEIQRNRSEYEENTKNNAKPTEVRVFDPGKFFITHNNIFSDEYIAYLEAIDPEICGSIGYVRIAAINAVRKDEDGTVKPITFPTVLTMMSGSSSMNQNTAMTSMTNIGLSAYPKTLGDGENYLERNYELLDGRYPEKITDLVMVIDSDGSLNIGLLEQLGFDIERDTISFEEIMKTKLQIVHNDAYYEELVGGFVITEENLEEILAAYPIARMMIPADSTPEETIAILNDIMAGMEGDESGSKVFLPSSGYEAMWDSQHSIELEIVGIVRQSDDSGIALIPNGLAYSDELCDLVIANAQDSEIVKAQLAQEESVFPSSPDSEPTPRDMMLSILGADTVPSTIMLYPSSFENKDNLIEYLDAWNNDRTEEEQIVYTDMAAMFFGFLTSIINAVTVVLIAFAAISLIVSLIMISIITYISVLERTKEIGILRALGARKKDVTRVFNAETFIIGAFSGIIGVLIAWGLTFPANMIIENMTNLPNVARLNPLHVIVLVILSTTLTVLGGSIPARIASKRDAVEALRSE
ncbi:MAG: ABC transporter ATP-binding protein/permease [Oscillospiraceae bacterium]|nr:ABC transporter ATP-binding protein/permease [Oscillospiraceae bacterium]